MANYEQIERLEMKELRLTGHETGALHFESGEGQEFRVAIDDSLRSALKAASSEQLQSASITPREIQERIRAGSSVEELAAISGAPISYIEKFAQTVFDELNHMVDSALAIRITIAGDRFNDEVQAEFGQIIESRLFASGAKDVRWSSKRQDAGAWLLTASYKLGDNEGVATWVFEPRKFHLVPENEAAVTLSNHDSGLDGPIPKLRSVVSPTPSNTASMPAATYTATSTEPDNVPAAFRRPEESSATDLLAELRKRREESAAQEEVTPAVEPETELEASITAFPEASPVQTLIQEHEVSPVTTSEPDPQHEDVREVVEQPAQQETAEEATAAVEQPESPKEAPKRSRAAMPSWDEIVFGTKADD